MALISCPNCGKRITDRTEICPHCNAVLVKKDNTPIVSKDSIISNGKKSIPGILIATAEALVFTRLLAVMFGALCNIHLGEDGKLAFSEGSRAFQPNIIIILMVGLIALCVLPSILEKITKVRAKVFIIVISVVLALVFGISYLSGSTAIKLLTSAKDANGYRIVKDANGYRIVGEEIFRYARYVLFFYAAALPLYQGMFCLLNQSVTNKKGYVLQAIFALIALVLTLILSFVALSVLYMGTLGTALAGVLASLIMLILAGIRKK